MFWKQVLWMDLQKEENIYISDEKNRLLDSVGEGEGRMIWEPFFWWPLFPVLHWALWHLPWTFSVAQVSQDLLLEHLGLPYHNAFTLCLLSHLNNQPHVCLRPSCASDTPCACHGEGAQYCLLIEQMSEWSLSGFLAWPHKVCIKELALTWLLGNQNILEESALICGYKSDSWQGSSNLWHQGP